uniref:tautomerase family protein n=1 Tax=Mycobacterium avium TaxID=1764 RepID=UPI000A67FBA9
MPLLYIDLIEGRTPSEVSALLDAIHDTVVEAFGVPPRDRYQVVHTHPAHEIVTLDTGLGIDRSSRQVVLHVVSRRRPRELKQKFYELLASRLAGRCGRGRLRAGRRSGGRRWGRRGLLSGSPQQA